MKKIWLFLLLLSTLCNAQQVTDNLITGSWNGVIISKEITGGGLTGGYQPAYNPIKNTIYFGYNQGTASQIIAINNALSGSGVQLTGYNYSWEWYNHAFSKGSLSATVKLTNSAGSSLESYYYDMNNKSNDYWQTMSGTQNFLQQYPLSSVGNLSVAFTGNDDRWWAGYYGPQVRNVQMSLRYSSDICATNPLYSKFCSGYEQAYMTQQCSINPLYSRECSGYSSAYYQQQCFINPLYDSGCPGYSQAYFNQQCNLNALYDRSCPNYNTEYAKQQLLNTTTSTTSTTNTSESTQISSTTSQTSPLSVTSVISVVSALSLSIQTISVPTISSVTIQTTEQKQENKKTENTISSIEKKTENKENIKKEITSKAQQAIKESANSKNMETQMQSQSLIVGLMGYVPNFNQYQNLNIRDINEIEMIRKYGRQPEDNRNVLRRMNGSSEMRWNQMIESQYSFNKNKE